MIKHKYVISGVDVGRGGRNFTGMCIAEDIVDAVLLPRESMLSVHSVVRGEQVAKDSPCGIYNIEIFD